MTSEKEKKSKLTGQELEGLIRKEIGPLIKDDADFKMIQINSYCGKTGVGNFEPDSILTIDEYLSKANLVMILLTT